MKKNTSSLIDLKNILGGNDVSKLFGQMLDTASFEVGVKELIDNGPLATYTAVIKGKKQATYISSSIKDLIGFTAKDFLLDPTFWQDHLHADDKPDVFKKIRRAEKTGNLFSVTYRMHAKDGSIVWINDNGTVLRNKKGQIVAHFGFMENITKLKEAQDMIAKEAGELRRKDDALLRAKRLSYIGTLASMLAHELRNPLGTINLSAHNMRKKVYDRSILDKLANIERSVNDCNRIINGMLNYANIKHPNYKNIALCDILKESIRSAKLRYGHLNVEFIKGFKKKARIFIEADPEQLKQVFDNILDNAYQSFLNGKGRIRFNVVKVKNKCVVVTFSDDGIGMVQEDMDRIFEPFFTKKPKGTGLGMLLCKELVTLHHGKINILSKFGRGTAVNVELPIKQA
jgi:PAS domain S-box-containing protein